MSHQVITLRRVDLVRWGACAEWMAFFYAVCAERGGGVEELAFEASPLAQVWLSRPLSPGSGTAWAWLRQHGFVAAAHLTGADLTAANLTAADLSDANLAGAALTAANLTAANLTAADLTAADLTAANLTWVNLTAANLGGANLAWANLGGAYLGGANLGGANLGGANLGGANLGGANLGGAYRLATDAAVEGWVIRHGRLERTIDRTQDDA